MNAPADIHSTKGWLAELKLEFIYRENANKTVLATAHHLGPLRVQRPFYPEGESCHVYLLHPPGGVVGGDTLNITIHARNPHSELSSTKEIKRSHALITTPGSTKFYRSAGDFSTVSQKIRVEENCTLEWFPQENIFFPGAKAKLTTEIAIEDGAQFIGWDINCLGRPTNNEKFDHGHFDSLLNISNNGKPILIERQRVFEERHLSSPSGLRDFPMNAIFICNNCNDEHTDLARNVIDNINPDFPTGVTLIEDILVFRALGESSEKLQAVMIPMWNALRSILCGKAPISPRIWAT